MLATRLRGINRSDVAQCCAAGGDDSKLFTRSLLFRAVQFSYWLGTLLCGYHVLRPFNEARRLSCFTPGGMGVFMCRQLYCCCKIARSIDT